MPLPTTGTTAPWPSDITDQNGHQVKLSDFAGKHVLLYFYPKDDTPGCTIEACNFRDHAPDLPGCVVLGASRDDAASHRAFIAKFQLPYPLLVDPAGALAVAYGAAADASVMHPSRISVLIGPDGNIKAAWPKVDPKIHWEEVRRALLAH